MITNLLCMWYLLWSSVWTATPSSANGHTSHPLNLAHWSSMMILTMTPALCLRQIASAMTQLLNAKMAMSNVHWARDIHWPTTISLAGSGKKSASSMTGHGFKNCELNAVKNEPKSSFDPKLVVAVCMIDSRLGCLTNLEFSVRCYIAPSTPD